MGYTYFVKKIFVLKTLFFVFERKVTKNFLYLHPKSVLIKVKSAEADKKTEISQGYKPPIVKPT